MFFKILTTILSLGAIALSGSIEDYFKPAVDKGDSNGIRNVDFIYIINLDKRPEKYQYCLQQLNEYKINPYRFSAVNGWEELTLEDFDQLGVEYHEGMQKGIWGTYFPLDSGPAIDEPIEEDGKRYFCCKMTKGAVGIVLSHLSVLQDAYDSGYETIWVMEDDIQVIRNPFLISVYIDRLNELVGNDGWDILFTDRDTKGKDGKYVICRSFAPRPNFTPQDPLKFAKEPEMLNADFRRIYARYGAYSMVIRRSGMKKILDFVKQYKVFLPYDMDYYLPEDIHLFSVMNDIVSTKPDALSDNGTPNY